MSGKWAVGQASRKVLRDLRQNARKSAFYPVTQPRESKTSIISTIFPIWLQSTNLIRLGKPLLEFSLPGISRFISGHGGMKEKKVCT